MLSIISLLTALGFAVTYPASFLISAHNPLKNNFHRFHMGLPLCVAGVVAAGLFSRPDFSQVFYLVVLWTVLFATVVALSWKKESPNAWLMGAVCLTGAIVYGVVCQIVLSDVTGATVFVGLLSAMIVSVALYAMNLGHWYLNVHGLDIDHLKRSTYVFWALVGIRAVWDVVIMVSQSVVYDGMPYSLLRFVGTLDGFLIGLAIFFGTVFPLVALYFVRGTLLVKSTQSATGILYVILSAILIGEIAYKYYLVKFGIPL